MVSFDVESLFTNIPLEECIDLAVNYISEGNPDLKLTEPELRSLFTVATAQTHFLFNGSFYDQIDGLAMGSPLAPVLANLRGFLLRLCLLRAREIFAAPNLENRRL